MIHKITKPALSVLLALVLVFSLMPTAFATTQSEIDALKSERAEIQARQSEVQSVIDGLRGQQSAYLQQKAALDEQCALTMQQISNISEQIELNGKLIEQKTVEVEKAQKVAEATF